MISLQLPQVPIPTRVVELVMDAIPESICEEVYAAEDAKREVLRFRPLASDEDRADLETALADLARANKILAAYDPRFIVRGAA
ncbi:hypothetical protein ACFWV1_13175 [Streptomyces sp. NPDC058700]|uniref:hypothetical protein n=1 Tax=Streptomyces sp. NPDC058700 TaxID=3346607 RepID=UPI0036554272